MYELIFPCIIVIIIFIFAYIKIRYPFWNLQPVFHSYDFWRYLYGTPFILQLYYPIKTKFYDPIQIQTHSYLDMSSSKKAQFVDLLQCHYIPSDKLQFTMTNEHIDSYFKGQEFPPFISFYNEKNYEIDPTTKNMTIICQEIPIGAMTSRSMNFYYINDKQNSEYVKMPIYYWDFICIHRDHKQNKIVRNLIQTHEHNQRMREPSVQVSMFKKEIELCDGVMPLLKFDTYTFYVNNGVVDPLPAHFVLTRVIKESAAALIDIFSELIHETTKHTFDICVLPEIASLIELIVANQVYVYTLKRRDDIYGVYFIKDAKMNYDYLDSGNTLHLIASIKNMRSVDLFRVGFLHCLKDILKRNQSYKMLMMENLGDNRFIVDEWSGNGSTVLFKTASAYYLYNMVYPRSPVNTNNCFLLTV